MLYFRYEIIVSSIFVYNKKKTQQNTYILFAEKRTVQCTLYLHARHAKHLKKSLKLIEKRAHREKSARGISEVKHRQNNSCVRANKRKSFFFY